MTADLRTLEMAGHATWPAFEEAWLGQWIIRAARGMTRRNNSVTPMGPPGIGLPTAIDWVEDWSAARDIPPIFRMTELAPPNLEFELRRRGYQREDTTIVMARPIGRVDADPEVAVEDRPGRDWLDLLLADGSKSPEQRDDVERLLCSGPPSAFATLRHGPNPIGIGSTAVAGETAAVFNMNTISGFRRQGVATRILSTLLSQAKALGADHAMLQVREDNPGALGLYEQAGFTERYRYWYFERAH